MPTIVKPDETIKVPGVKPRTTSTGTNIRFNPFRFKIGKNPFHEKVHTLNTSSGQPQIKIPVPGEGLPRVIHFCADQSGCGFWRMLWPAHDLLAYNKAVVMNLYQMVFDPRFYGGVDAVRVQRQATDSQLEFMKFLRKTSNEFKRQTGKGFKILYDVDDICAPADCIADYNVCKQGFTEDKILENMKAIVALTDEMTVVSEYMKEHYKKYLEFDNITVLPNYAPKHIFDSSFDMNKILFNFKKNRKRPRILYAGSMTHFDVANRANQKDDFHHVVEAIHRDLTVDKKYEWVFMGGALPLSLRGFINKGIEFHPWSPLPEYAQVVKNLNCQIMLAPLVDNPFNKAKSNIKLTEGGMFGIPVVAQDLDCYNHNGWKYLFKTGADMMGQIESILKNEATFKQAVEFGKKYAEQYYLKDHLDEYIFLYTTPYGDEKRKDNKWFLGHNRGQFAS
jgi:hypothetical protein